MYDAYIPWVLGIFVVSLFVGQAIRLWWKATEWKRRRRQPNDED